MMSIVQNRDKKEEVSDVDGMACRNLKVMIDEQTSSPGKGACESFSEVEAVLEIRPGQERASSASRFPI